LQNIAQIEQEMTFFTKHESKQFFGEGFEEQMI